MITFYKKGDVSHSFYRNNLYCKESSKYLDKEEKIDLITKFFDKESFTHKQKLKALRSWRYILKDEYAAYLEGASAIIKQSSHLEGPLTNTLNCYHFPEKLKILEEMIVQETGKESLLQKLKANKPILGSKLDIEAA